MRASTWMIGLAVATLSGCASQAPPTSDGLVVMNFKEGLMRNAGSSWEVHEPGQNFKYKHNGNCVANGVERRCMWHGFTFDYVAAKEKTELSCVQTRNRPQHLVNPGAEIGVKKDSEFKMLLPAKKGFYEGVGYQTPRNELPGTASLKTVCSYGGRVVFESNFAVTYTESDIAAYGN